MLSIYLDLHGHSLETEAFFYGCADTTTGSNHGRTFREQILPILTAEQTPLVRYDKCKFGVKPSKLSTARVAVYKEFNLIDCFTLEASTGGRIIEDKFEHWSIAELEAIGLACGAAFHALYMLMGTPNGTQVMLRSVREKKMQEKKLQMELDPLSDSSADDESDPGSDAEPWEGNLDMEELQERWGMLHNARQEATKEALVDAEQHKRQQRTADRRRESKQEEQEQRKATALPLVPKSKKAVDRSGSKVHRNTSRNKTFPGHRKNSDGDAADGRPNNHSQSELSLPYFSDREMKRGRQLHSSHQRRSPGLSMITQADRRKSRSNISEFFLNNKDDNPGMARPASREGRERRQGGSMIALSSKGLPKQRQQLACASVSWCRTPQPQPQQVAGWGDDPCQVLARKTSNLHEHLDALARCKSSMHDNGERGYSFSQAERRRWRERMLGDRTSISREREIRVNEYSTSSSPYLAPVESHLQLMRSNSLDEANDELTDSWLSSLDPAQAEDQDYCAFNFF